MEYRVFGGYAPIATVSPALPALASRHALGEGLLTAGVSYHFR